MRNVMFVHEETLTFAGGDEQPALVKAPNDAEGGVFIDYVSHDGGNIAAGTHDQVQVKVIPQRQTDLVGGDVFHTFAALPGVNTQTNIFKLGIQLKPGEDLKLVFISQDAGDLIIRVQGTKKTP